MADGWAFIVNPIAGNGFGATCVAAVRDEMKRHGVQGEVVTTRAKGHATELAAELSSRGCRTIVGVGGDGTLSEIAQGLVGAADVTLGAVAAGTGNDFVHALGFPDRFEHTQWDSLFRGETALMDVGRCNGRTFINGMGLGVDAQIAADNYRMESGGVRRGSKAKYTWHIVRNLLFYREAMMRVTVDGRTEERRTFLNTIANGRRLAGGLELTPRAFVNDGLLDVCSTGVLSVPSRFGIFTQVRKKEHLQNAAVKYLQTARLHYEYDMEMPAHLDGEMIFAREFAVDILPGALRVIYDAKSPHYFRP